MKKIYIIPLTFSVLGLGCWVAYVIKGSYVAPDGLLIEPFYLIPVGWLFIFLGLAILVVVILSKKNRKLQR